ncbi:hypothetical protein JKP88DRAFT_265304 [Tribonema minus]|uniref:Uncharacterized protein n=1 Tax=Tribonema minus TaxID=303371 RepID=A0A835YKN1_9STRA|nr:hypothetical protein JKP88DRAFT_265304 [Tribonema minus]
MPRFAKIAAMVVHGMMQPAIAKPARGGRQGGQGGDSQTESDLDKGMDRHEQEFRQLKNNPFRNGLFCIRSVVQQDLKGVKDDIARDLAAMGDVQRLNLEKTFTLQPKRLWVWLLPLQQQKLMAFWFGSLSIMDSCGAHGMETSNIYTIHTASGYQSRRLRVLRSRGGDSSSSRLPLREDAPSRLSRSPLSDRYALSFSQRSPLSEPRRPAPPPLSSSPHPPLSPLPLARSSLLPSTSDCLSLPLPCSSGASRLLRRPPLPPPSPPLPSSRGPLPRSSRLDRCDAASPRPPPRLSPPSSQPPLSRLSSRLTAARGGRPPSPPLPRRCSPRLSPPPPPPFRSLLSARAGGAPLPPSPPAASLSLLSPRPGAGLPPSPPRRSPRRPSAAGGAAAAGPRSRLSLSAAAAAAAAAAPSAACSGGGRHSLLRLRRRGASASPRIAGGSRSRGGNLPPPPPPRPFASSPGKSAAASGPARNGPRRMGNGAGSGGHSRCCA